MRIIIMHSPDKGSERQALEFSDKVKRDTSNRDVEVVSAGGRRGQELANLYGVVEYPAVLSLHGGDSSVLKMWTGSFPVATDLSPHFIA